MVTTTDKALRVIPNRSYEGTQDVFVLLNIVEILYYYIARADSGVVCTDFEGRKEGNVLFNDALNTFYLRLYGVSHMVKEGRKCFI